MKITLGHAGHIKLLLICLIAGLSIVSAGNPSDSVTVYFRTGQSLFDDTYSTNGPSMNNFIGSLRASAADIDSVIVSGYVSPEGHTLGDPLSMQRCHAVAEYITLRSGINPDLISVSYSGVDWSLLRHLIANTPDVPSRRELLEVIDTYPEWVYDSKGKIIDGRNRRLRLVAGGHPYKWLLANIFPQLRTAVAVTLRRETPPSPSATPEQQPVRESLDSIEAFVDEAFDSVKTWNITEAPAIPDSPGAVTALLSGSPKPFYMAVKTNMLYDAALIPNLAAEFYLGKNISVYGDWMYAWWSRDLRHRYWRIYGGDIGARWWFGHKAHEKPLTGHHLGIFAGVLTFDFEAGDHGYMGGKPGGTLWDRCLVNSGIEYGYSLPVSSRLNIDFSIALGFLSGNYIKYFPFDNEYFKEKEYKMRFVGPTKAEVSLVWLIGRGNVNNRKGGDR